MLRVKQLTITRSSNPGRPIVKNISFEVNTGECVGIVGPSGVGKSLTALSPLGLIPSYSQLTVTGTFEFDNKSFDASRPMQLAELRGEKISLVQQEAQSALNPVRTCGKQLADVFQRFGVSDKQEIKRRSIEILDKLSIEDPERILQSYPHQISGGQKQRLLIALAFVCPSSLVILDEPTASLDLITSREIMDELQLISRKENRSLLIVSHERNLISKYCNRIYEITSAGEMVELKEFSSKTGSHATPNHDAVKDEVILKFKGVGMDYIRTRSFFGHEKRFNALEDISFEIKKGEAVALIGRSGSGKSTVAKLITKLLEPTIGNIHFFSQNLNDYSQSELKKYRRSVQMIFQDPGSALSPRLTVRDQLSELNQYHHLYPSAEEERRITEVLQRLNMDTSVLHKFPHELSGGQKQRVYMAKVLMMDADLIICDECLVSLDPETQDLLIHQFEQLNASGKTLLFITHDMRVIRRLCNRVLVLDKGKLVENRPTLDLLQNPESDIAMALTREEH